MSRLNTEWFKYEGNVFVNMRENKERCLRKCDTTYLYNKHKCLIETLNKSLKCYICNFRYFNGAAFIFNTLDKKHLSSNLKLLFQLLLEILLTKSACKRFLFLIHGNKWLRDVSDGL